MYKPAFKCKFCDKLLNCHVNGVQGVLTLCDCKESREEWEKEHRIEMERRKRLRNGR